MTDNLHCISGESLRYRMSQSGRKQTERCTGEQQDLYKPTVCGMSALGSNLDGGQFVGVGGGLTLESKCPLRKSSSCPLFSFDRERDPVDTVMVRSVQWSQLQVDYSPVFRPRDKTTDLGSDTAAADSVDKEIKPSFGTGVGELKNDTVAANKTYADGNCPGVHTNVERVSSIQTTDATTGSASSDVEHERCETDDLSRLSEPTNTGATQCVQSSVVRSSTDKGRWRLSTAPGHQRSYSANVSTELCVPNVCSTIPRHPVPPPPPQQREQVLGFVEGGGGRRLVYGSDGYFPRPRHDQSLAAFLGSHEFRRNVAELDRENAHFCISESLIAAFEMTTNNPASEPNSWYVRNMKLRRILARQRVKGNSIRRKLLNDVSQAQLDPTPASYLSETGVVANLSPPSQYNRSPPSSEVCFSVGSDDVAALRVSGSGSQSTLSTSASLAFLTSPFPSPEQKDCERSDRDLDHHHQSLLFDCASEECQLSTSLHPASLSSRSCHLLSSASSASSIVAVPVSRAGFDLALASGEEDDVAGSSFVHRPDFPLDDGTAGAEKVALSLLACFPGRSLPKASELCWLLPSEQCMTNDECSPSTDLPLTDEDSASDLSCSESHERPASVSIALRGTYHWAPPRPQIIFSLHKHERLSVVMTRQRYLCAGCGQRVDRSLAHKYRWCEYLGRYFCTACHHGDLFYIPARILHKYDFSRYPVSVFSRQLLTSIWRDPLFHVRSVNAEVSRHASFVDCHVVRRRLALIRPYVETCRFAIASVLKKFPMPDRYLVDEIDLYSLRDLFCVENGTLAAQLKAIYFQYEQHCLSCQLCRGRGYLCQLCVLGDDYHVRGTRSVHVVRHTLRRLCLWLCWCCVCAGSWDGVCANCCDCALQLCSGRGHLCQLCQSAGRGRRLQQPIFPFQLERVDQCSRCGACYHSACLTPGGAGCVRCRRVQQRRQFMAPDQREPLDPEQPRVDSDTLPLLT